MSLLQKALAVVCPPLAVASVEGLSTHVAWNLLYTLCFYLPGVADAFLTVHNAGMRTRGVRLFPLVGRRKVLFVGRGAMATSFGWALSRAGHHVDYLVRPKHLLTYKTSLDIDLIDMRGGGLFGVRNVVQLETPLIGEIPADHDYDVIIISVQHYNFPAAFAQVAPRAGKATVLCFNNLWIEPLEATSALPRDSLAFGFPTAGGGFPDNDHFVGTLMPTVQFGTFGTDPTAREEAVRDIFRSAGFGVAEERDFRGWLLAHFALNGALHSEALRAGGHMRVMASHALRSRIAGNLAELIPLLRAREMNIANHGSQLGMARAPGWVISCLFKVLFTYYTPVRRVLAYNSNPLDPALTCRDLAEDAAKLGVPVPRLDEAVAIARARGENFTIPSAS